MSNSSTNTPFPATQQDVARLKQTAIDAASDLSSTASVHASKAKEQFRDLAGHAREEGSEHLGQVKGKVTDLLNAGRDYAVQNPLTCIGAALALGFLIGLTRHRSTRE